MFLLYPSKNSSSLLLSLILPTLVHHFQSIPPYRTAIFHIASSIDSLNQIIHLASDTINMPIKLSSNLSSSADNGYGKNLIFLIQPFDPRLFRNIGSRDATFIFFTNERQLLTNSTNSMQKAILGRSRCFTILNDELVTIGSSDGYKPFSSSVATVRQLAVQSETFQLRGGIVKVFLMYHPPSVTILPLERGYFYVGADSYFLSIFVRKFQMTTYSCTNILATSLGDLFFDLRRFDVIKSFHRNVYVPNEVTEFNKTATDAPFDVFLSVFYMQPQHLDRFSGALDYLYPHRFDCLIALVPRRNVQVPVLLRVATNGEVQTIFIVYLAFVLAQLMIRKYPNAKQIITIVNSVWFRTIGLCLAQTSDMDQSGDRLQLLWTVGLLVFSITSPVILAGVIYQSLVMAEWEPNIDTLDELVARNYTIYTVDILGDGGAAWLSNLNKNLSSKFKIANVAFILGKVFSQSLHNEAVTIQQSRLGNLFSWLHSVKNVPIDDNIYHPIMEPVYCGLIANRIVHNSPLQFEMNRLRRRLEETGLMISYNRWYSWFYDSMTPPLNAQTMQGHLDALTVGQLGGIFNLYLVGMGISCGVLMLEIGRFKYLGNK